MSIKSINEPDDPSHTTMLTPMSINEPKELPDGPGYVPPIAVPGHRGTPTKTLSNKRSRNAAAGDAVDEEDV